MSVMPCILQGMTTPSPVPATQRPERVIVKPARYSRLEALLCEYGHRKQEAADAEQRFKELKAAIAAELEDMYPFEVRPSVGYEIPATSMFPSLSISYKSQTYLPVGDIRTNFPAIYEAFKKESTFVEVRESQKGKGR